MKNKNQFKINLLLNDQIKKKLYQKSRRFFQKKTSKDRCASLSGLIHRGFKKNYNH